MSATEEPPVVVVVVPETESVPVAVVAEEEKKEEEKETVQAETVTGESEPEPEKITQQNSFKEETNVVSDLPESQRKALDELKKLISEACAKREFSAPPPPPTPVPAVVKEEQPAPSAAEEAVPTPADAVTAASGSEAAVTIAVDAETAVTAIEESLKTEEAPKTEEPPKTEETPPAVAAPKPEEEGEKAAEDIKETIVEVVAAASVDEPSPKETESTAAATTQEPETEAAVASVPPPPPEPLEPEEVSIWGIPLLADERTDVILLKFLRARDFKVKDAFTMIRNTVRWRNEFRVDEIIDEDLGNDYEKVLFTHGYDKEGRIVCYNVFGEFENKELYQNTFSDGEKRKKFLKWLIQFLEKIIRELDFSEKGVNSIVLVNDLKNSPGYGKKKDVSKIIDKFLLILQDNYPEFVAKQLCINTSWWYVAYYWIYLTVFTPRSKSKFVFASPSKTPETLFTYIAPEHVPIQYGGHSKIGENEFTPADPVTEVIVKPGTKHPIEFAFSEAAELVWELRVIGWDVNYGAEFSPAKEGGYTLNISKPKKVAPTDEPVISDSFKVTEAGKVVITIDNQSSKKKKLLYRSKVKTSE